MSEVKPKRLLSIDRFRGFLVFAMCFFIIAAEFPSLGFISTIANNSKTTRIMIMENFSLADLENPSFIFLISLSYFGSFKKRYEKDKKGAYIHFIKRYLIFMGLGSIMVSGEYFFANNGTDPFIIQTILMFIAMISLVLFLLSKLFKLKDKYKNVLSKILSYSLLTLGVFGLFLGLRDDIILFSRTDLPIYRHWSILHEIGFTGLLGLLVVNLSQKDKILTWFYLVILYTIVLSFPGMISLFDYIVLGGMVGTFGWLIILLGGMILMEFFKNKHYKEYVISCIVLGLLGYFLTKIMIINTSAGTTNYLVLSLLFDALIFAFINLFNNKEFKFEYLVWWGRNPLPLYFIILIFRLIEKIWAPSVDTSFIVAFLFTFGTLFINSFVAYILYKKDIIIKL